MIKKDNTTLKQQFELEKKWRNIILHSEKSVNRKEIIKQAYREVNDLMESYGTYHYDLQEKALKQFDLICKVLPKRNAKFLDIGCSSGALVIEALKNGWDAYGIDIEEESIQIAKKRYKEEFSNDSTERFFQGELEDLKINQFDLIFHSDVLEHIHPDEVQDFMQTTYNLLKLGAYLVSNTPYKLSGPKDISKYFLPKGAEAQGLHLKEYLLKDMVMLYNSVGFSCVKSYLLNPIIYENYFGLNKKNTIIKLFLEKILLLTPKALLIKVVDTISGRFNFSITIGVK